MNIRQHLFGVATALLTVGCASSPALRQDQAIRALSDFRGWHISAPTDGSAPDTPYHDTRIQAAGQRCLNSYLSGVMVIDHQISQPDVNLVSRSRTLRRASAAAAQIERRLQRCANAEGVSLELTVVTAAGVMRHSDWLEALAAAFERSAHYLSALDVDRRIQLPIVALSAHQAGRIGEDSYFALGEYQELGVPASEYPPPAYTP